MGQTRWYNLAFFDFGDDLSTSLSIQKETDRFVVIDKQLYGLYRIFGNGVIAGFDVSDAGFKAKKGICVNVSQGNGIINYLAAQTETPGAVINLPPNSVVDIYANISGSTYLDRSVGFYYSLLPAGSGAIRLATVSTGADSILYIDNTTKNRIGFEQIVQDAIDLHKHRGTPTKIDLATETKNQLPGARLEGIPSSKVTSGQFGIDRIPLIDHTELENKGLLTHASLDSFVKTFSQNNVELLGEISSINLLKSIIFWKYKYADVDEFFVNEIALIPGVSPNSFIDFDNSTAIISLDDQCISGLPTKIGRFTSVLWDDTFSFNTAIYKSNMIIENDTVFLTNSSEIVETVVDFDNNQMTLTPQTLIVDDQQNAEVTTIADGNRVGRLGGGGTLNYFYRQNFEQGKNWDGTFDTLTIQVKTDVVDHSPVYMYLLNGSNINSEGNYGSLEVGDINPKDEDGNNKKRPSSSWEILSSDENMPELVEKEFDISELGLTDVTQITIYTDDDFVFDIDNIQVKRTNMVSKTGTIRFQYQTSASVVFHSIFYDASTAEGTSISTRIKTAADPALLPVSSYSLPLNSGDVIATTGDAAEIEIIMTSNESQTLSPILNSLELRMLVDADFTGFVIDTEEEWEEGTLSNITVNDAEEIGKSILNISTPINVGGRYFAKSSSVSEMGSDDIGTYGFSGNLMPVSPNQARSWSVSSTRGFSTVSSVVRKFDHSFLIADLNNNRIMQVDKDGALIKGIGSAYSIDDSFYPLSAVYNPDKKILTIVFTKSAIVVDITKISLWMGSMKMSLSSDDTVLSENKALNKILEILLDDDLAVQLLGATTSNLSVNLGAGAFSEDIVVRDGMTVEGNSIFSPLKGLSCFVGDFTYMDNIRHPVFVYETSEDNWMIGNSSIFYEEIDPLKEEENAVVPDIIEIDPDDVSDTENKLISTDVAFSDYTIGGIYEYDEGRFVVSGIEESSTTLTGITGTQLLDQYGGEAVAPESIKFRAAAVDALASYAGRVFVLDKNNNRKQILYSSPDNLYPSDISGCSNGDMIIAESSVANVSGRIIRIDGYGNIVKNYGQNTLAIINDAKTLNDDKLIVSV
jgi:hypothetical protein